MQVSARKLCVGYDEKIIVNEFDITINKGEITTIIGPNGCGKSTLLKTLTRMINRKSGEVLLGGKDISKIPSKEISQKIAVLAQQQYAPPDFKVKELVSYGRMPHQKWFQVNTKEDEKIVDWAMDCTSISHMKERSINSLSGGEKQRAWIATALAQKPEILFLDEPTTYLDIAHQIEVMDIVKKLNRENGIGVVMVLHDITQAIDVSDRIVVIKNGIKYCEGRPKDVVTSKMIKEVYNVDAQVVTLPERKSPVVLFNGVIN